MPMGVLKPLPVMNFRVNHGSDASIPFYLLCELSGYKNPRMGCTSGCCNSLCVIQITNQPPAFSCITIVTNYKHSRSKSETFEQRKTTDSWGYKAPISLIETDTILIFFL